MRGEKEIKNVYRAVISKYDCEMFIYVWLWTHIESVTIKPANLVNASWPFPQQTHLLLFSNMFITFD